MAHPHTRAPLLGCVSLQLTQAGSCLGKLVLEWLCLHLRLLVEPRRSDTKYWLGLERSAAVDWTVVQKGNLVCFSLPNHMASEEDEASI